MQRSILIAAMFVTGFCGMVAEYSVSTAVAYYVGNSVAAFSIVISTFMFAMGAGSLWSRRIEGRELEQFLLTECALSVVAGASIIFIAQASRIDLTWEAALFASAFLGLLIGFEIPLLMRVNEQQEVILKENAARVFFADYAGSAVAGATFATVLLPVIGLVHTPILCGSVNLAVAAVMALVFRREQTDTDAAQPYGMRVWWAVAGAALALVTFGLRGNDIVFDAEQAAYEERIVFAQQSAYQKIVVTEDRTTTGTLVDRCLYLDGHTQFCTSDEHRYHETLVHPALWLASDARRVLILGGGDGIAVREVLKHPGIGQVTLVDLDPVMLELARTHALFTATNAHALADKRVTVVTADAYPWLRQNREFWDVIIADFPDPSVVETAKLYSYEFYRAVGRRLAPCGVFVTQSTSPIHAREVYLTIRVTMEAAGFEVLSHRVNVPTFGDWGFHIGAHPQHMAERDMRDRLEVFVDTVPTRYLNREAMQAGLRWEKGMWNGMDALAPSRLARPRVQQIYASAWTIE